MSVRKKKTCQEKPADAKGFPKVCPIDRTKGKRYFMENFEQRLATLKP